MLKPRLWSRLWCGMMSSISTAAAGGEGFVEICEGRASILFPSSNEVFYNPVQEFNRDIRLVHCSLRLLLHSYLLHIHTNSIAVIKRYSEEMWSPCRSRKKARPDSVDRNQMETAECEESVVGGAQDGGNTPQQQQNVSDATSSNVSRHYPT